MAGRASIVGAAATHVGKVRDHNEDAHFFDADLGVFLVCDGMGGHAAGEVASALAIREICEAWRGDRLHKVAEDWLERGTPDARKQLIDVVRAGVIAAHRAIVAEAERDDAKSGMGTTLVGAMIVGGELVFAHAGDSRAYLVRDGISMQLTEDHTLLARLLAAGIDVDVTGEGARFRSMLTNALGIGEECKVSTFVVPLADGDRFLLCSDGISEYVPENEVGEVLTKQQSPARAAQRLIDLALERGGGDNATAIVVRVLEAGETPLPAEQRRKDDAAIGACALWGRRVTPQQRLRALRIAIPRDHGFGDKLPAHTLGDRVAWIIVDGELVQDGQTLGPGAFVYPESLLLGSEPAPLPDRDAMAITRTDVRALAIRADDFRELCDDDGELGEALLESLAQVVARKKQRAPTRDAAPRRDTAPGSDSAVSTHPGIRAVPAGELGEAYRATDPSLHVAADALHRERAMPLLEEEPTRRGTAPSLPEEETTRRGTAPKGLVLEDEPTGHGPAPALLEEETTRRGVAPSLLEEETTRRGTAPKAFVLEDEPTRQGPVPTLLEEEPTRRGPAPAPGSARWPASESAVIAPVAARPVAPAVAPARPSPPPPMQARVVATPPRAVPTTTPPPVRAASTTMPPPVRADAVRAAPPTPLPVRAAPTTTPPPVRADAVRVASPTPLPVRAAPATTPPPVRADAVRVASPTPLPVRAAPTTTPPPVRADAVRAASPTPLPMRAAPTTMPPPVSAASSTTPPVRAEVVRAASPTPPPPVRAEVVRAASPTPPPPVRAEVARAAPSTTSPPVRAEAVRAASPTPPPPVRVEAQRPRRSTIDPAAPTTPPPIRNERGMSPSEVISMGTAAARRAAASSEARAAERAASPGMRARADHGAAAASGIVVSSGPAARAEIASASLAHAITQPLAVQAPVVAPRPQRRPSAPLPLPPPVEESAVAAPVERRGRRPPSEPEIETYFEIEADEPPESGDDLDVESELAISIALSGDLDAPNESVSISLDEDVTQVMVAEIAMADVAFLPGDHTIVDQRQRAITAEDGAAVSGTISIPEGIAPPSRRAKRQGEGWED